MSVLEVAAIIAAGFAAGTINTIVGSGSLITFPTLLVLGYPPLTANVSNNIGLVPGGVSGSYGYRHELEGHSQTLFRLGPLSFVGSVVGASLLLVLPPEAFKAIVPVLIAIALVLVLVGPWLQRRVAERSEDEAEPGWHRWALGVGIFVAGAYGGYFGAAQGVLLMGIFSALSSEPLQRLNAYKNVLSSIVNAVAAVTFVLFARGLDRLVGRPVHRGRVVRRRHGGRPRGPPDPAGRAAWPHRPYRDGGDRQAGGLPLMPVRVTAEDVRAARAGEPWQCRVCRSRTSSCWRTTSASPMSLCGVAPSPSAGSTSPSRRRSSGGPSRRAIDHGHC